MNKHIPFLSLKQTLTATAVTASLALSGCLNTMKLDENGDPINPTRLQKLLDLSVAPPPPKVNFELTYYCNQQTWNQYEDFIAQDYSVKIERGLLKADTDNDGVTDETEIGTATTLGLNPSTANSAVIGMSDLMLFRAGILIADQPRLRCLPGEANTDQDQDGLTDCEEKRMSYTKPDLYDTDGDGIPDGLELRYGLNPKNVGDASADPDNDGVSNFDEVKFNTPVGEDNKQPSIAQLKFDYRIERQQTNSQGQICTVFKVSNVRMLPERINHFMKFYFYERANTNTNRGKRQLEFQLMIDINQWAEQTVRCTLQGPAQNALTLTAPQTPDCPY